MKKNSSCAICTQLKPHHFKSSKDFLDCLQSFKSLLESGNFEFVSSNFELEQPTNDEGFWQNDILHYTIRCKECGRKFCCSCDTYHGNGGLEVAK